MELSFMRNRNSNGITITKCIETYDEEEILIPNEIDGSPVTRIWDMAFENYITIKSITLPDTIRRIGVNAFKGCISLTSINIPDSVTQIFPGAFEGCTSLESVTISRHTVLGYPDEEDDSFPVFPENVKINYRNSKKEIDMDEFERDKEEEEMWDSEMDEEESWSDDDDDYSDDEDDEDNDDYNDDDDEKSIFDGLDDDDEDEEGVDFSEVADKVQALDQQAQDAYRNSAFTKAIELLNQAISICPAKLTITFNDGYTASVSSHLYNIRACSYQRLNQLDNAIADLNKVIERDPDYPMFWGNRAEMYEGKGDYQKAIADCKKALELDSDNKNAKEILTRCEEALKKAPAAKPSTDQKACPSCGKQLKSTAKFCGKCGMKLDNVCSNCGKVLKEGAKFCGKCGTKQ